MIIKNRCWLFVILAVVVFFSVPRDAIAAYPDISFNNSDEWIANVEFAHIQNNTSAPSVNGYGDYTVMETGFMTNIVPGGMFALNVTLGHDSDVTLHNEYIYAFFDWNGNESFTDTGETVTVVADASTAGPHTANVTVPIDAVAGEIRMRIVLIFDHNVPLSSGTGLFSGEAEDYSLWVPARGLYRPIWGDNTNSWITNVTFGSRNVTSGQEPNGYRSYIPGIWYGTRDFTEVAPDVTYPLSIKIDPGAPFEHVSAFFDWNGNGLFTDPEEEVVVTAATSDAGPHIVDVKVPASVVFGDVFMRIVLKSSSGPPSWGNIGLGEAEDYLLFVPSPDNYSPIWTADAYEWITNITFGNINNDSKSEGYGNYTIEKSGKMAAVAPGRTYSLSVTSCPIIYPEQDAYYVNAFFDWNRNGSFAESGEKVVVVANTTETGPHKVDIIIPQGVTPGECRMRVVLTSGYSDPPGWGYIVSGEAEDYSVVIRRFPWTMFLPAINNNEQP